jgi:hypothetical protein
MEFHPGLWTTNQPGTGLGRAFDQRPLRMQRRLVDLPILRQIHRRPPQVPGRHERKRQSGRPRLCRLYGPQNPGLGRPRDGSPDQQGSLIQIDHLPQSAPSVLKDGKTRVKILNNPQTETAVDQLACVLDVALPVGKGTLKIPGNISKWGALLVELSRP